MDTAIVPMTAGLVPSVTEMVAVEVVPRGADGSAVTVRTEPSKRSG